MQIYMLCLRFFLYNIISMVLKTKYLTHSTALYFCRSAKGIRDKTLAN